MVVPAPVLHIPHPVRTPSPAPAPEVYVETRPVTPAPVFVRKDRRKMSASNLVVVNPERRARITKLLFRRGMFIHISRIFQEGQFMALTRS